MMVKIGCMDFVCGNLYCFMHIWVLSGVLPQVMLSVWYGGLLHLILHVLIWKEKHGTLAYSSQVGEHI